MVRIFLRQWMPFSLALFVALAIPAALSASELKSLTLSEAGSFTRIELALSGAPNHKVFTLNNPDRLVLDIDGGALAKGFAPGPVTGKVLQVRTGQPEPGQLRVVLDLVEPVQPRTHVLAASGNQPQRLVVELHPRGAAQAVTAARTVQDIVPQLQRDIVIAIDAGHGGKDPGAVGPTGRHEKDITLAVARDMAKQIDALPGFKAVLVRDNDTFIALPQRYQIARRAQADLFVSVHADAAHNRNANGASVYVLSLRGASSQAASWLADRENAADLVGGVKLDDKDDTLAAVLLDLSQSATMRASEDVAGHVLNGLKRVGKAHKPQVERANFVVLRSPDVPSLLVETGFISNPNEERKLSDPAYRRQLAAAITEGVRSFFHTQPPPDTWLAANLHTLPGTAREHVVVRGDTLSGIAARYGVSVASLRRANSLGSDVVKLGQRLNVPAPSAVAGVVAAGSGLSR